MTWAQPGEYGRGGENGKPPHRNFAEVWKLADKDGDGAISRQEFDQMPRTQKLPEDKRAAVFGRLDKDQDGSISREEIRQIMQDEQGGDAKPRMWELDANKDGGVTFEEFKQGQMMQKLDPERQERIFKHLDTNGDGKITPDDKPMRRPRPDGEEGPGGKRPMGPDGEGKRPMGPDGKRPMGPDGEGKRPERPGPGAMIEHLDQDKDGALSFEEFRNNPRAKELGDEEAQKRFKMRDRNGDGKCDKQDLMHRDGKEPLRDFRRPGAGPEGPSRVD